MATMTDPENRPRRTTSSAHYFARCAELAKLLQAPGMGMAEVAWWVEYIADDGPHPLAARPPATGEVTA